MAWNRQEAYNELPPLPPTPTLPETLRCREALWAGSERMRHRDLSVGIATVICSEITGISMNVRRLAGTRIGNPVTGEIVYAPPEGREEILVNSKNWENFLHAGDDLDPIVRMATAHYQFEAIHPFPNGTKWLNALVGDQALEKHRLGRMSLFLNREFLELLSRSECVA